MEGGPSPQYLGHPQVWPLKPRPVGLPPAGWRVEGAQELEAQALGGACAAEAAAAAG